MSNRKQFLKAYEALSPLEAFAFAHEVALQFTLRQKRLQNDINKSLPADAGDMSYSLNRAFELLYLSLWDEEYGSMDEEDDAEGPVDTSASAAHGTHAAA